MKTLLIILLLTSNAWAQEVITTFNGTPSILNEELRKSRADIRNIKSVTFLNDRVQNSIVSNTSTVKMELSGDLASPGNSKYYGTNSTGVKGWSNYTQLAIPTPVTQVNDVETGGVTLAGGVETEILNVSKTITSGNTVMLIASGSLEGNISGNTVYTIRLKQGSTVVQQQSSALLLTSVNGIWSACGVATGLSGSIPFTVTANCTATSTGKGNLIVQEF